MFANRTPDSAIAIVRNNALRGSPFFDVTANGLRKGTIPSAAIACSKRGAPVHYKPISNTSNNFHHTQKAAKLIKVLPAINRKNKQKNFAPITP